MSASCRREWLSTRTGYQGSAIVGDSHDFGDDASGVGIGRGGVGKAAGEVNFVEPELGEAFGVGCGVDVGEHELDVRHRGGTAANPASSGSSS